jgi:AraC-like DNA-binding protein
MSVSHTTADIEPARRFEYWVDVVCNQCIPATSKPLTEAPFDAQLATSAVGAVEISVMTAPLHWWSRDPVHLRKSPEDDLWIGYMADGQAAVSQHGRQALLGNGNLVLYDAARPFEFSLEAKRIYLVRMPRRSLVQRCPSAERLTACLIDDSQPAAAPLRSMVECAVKIDFDKMRPGAAAQFGSTLLDLAAITLEFQTGAVEPAWERDLYRRVVAYIERSLEDPELCLDTLAEVHHVSSRTITRAFARHQQTAIGMVWRLRLEASRRALIEGRARSVTQAAFDHGFSDTSHFSRAFREAFGCAPSTLIQH